MPFPATPLLDTFANELELPATFPAMFTRHRVENPMTFGGWWNPGGVADIPPMQSSGGQAFSTVADGTAAGSEWTAAMWARVEVWFQVSTWPANANERCVVTAASMLGDPTDVAPTIGSVDGWTIRLYNATGGSVDVRRFTAGQASSASLPGFPVGNIGTFQSGDGIGMAVNVDSTIVVYRRRAGVWSQLVTVTDPSPLPLALDPEATVSMPLYIGMQTNAADARFDSFGGGGLFSPPAAATITPPALISV